MTTPYKLKIPGDTVADLEARLATYKNGPHWKAAIRNPAYCKMFWPGGEIPVDTVKWNETYRPGKYQKPAPALQSVEIIMNPVGKGTLSMSAKFAVKLFTKQDFAEYVDTLCKQGNMLTFKWGYDLPFGTVYSGKTISGFKLSNFTFNTQPDGTYIIEGEAIGPAISINGLNANFEVKTTSPVREYINDGKKYLVTGIVELLTYWAQGNGKKSIDEMLDGDVLIVPSGQRSDKSNQPMGSIMIFDSKHLEKKGFGAAVGRFVTAITTTNNELTKTNNIIYVSLETLVGIFNTEIFPMYNKIAQKAENNTDFSKLTIEFDPNMSFSYIDTDIRSAYPTKVLLMDQRLANYKNINKAGKDFYKDSKNKSEVKTVVGAPSYGRNKIDLKRIFLERSVILAALDGAQIKPGEASTISHRTNRDASINVHDFFTRIFEEIKSATGDRISLNLSMHPYVFDSNDKLAYKLFIFDETNGFYEPPFEVWEFNPIDGDGTTRTFSIKSDMGGQNYQVSQFGPTIDPDALAQAEGHLPAIDTARAAERALTKKNIEKIITNPGQIGDSAFDEVHMQALKSAFVKLKDCEPSKKICNNLTFIGMGCEVELDGIWGLNPGMGIWSTQMPDKYKKNNVYFHITSTIHKFDGNTSDWSTNLSGLLIGHEKVTYTPAAGT
jgi:hypothetical protein